MKILIVDNDENIRTGIISMLKKLCPQITLIYEASGVKDGIHQIKKLLPDIVLLDVEMDDGTGFDLLKKIEHFDFSLIFITAYNKYAVTAFKYSAIDFLEKPIDPSDLVKSIQKAIENLHLKSLKKQVQILEESLVNLRNQKAEDKKIALHDGKSIYFVNVTDIVYCNAEGAYTRFILVGQKPILMSKNLKEFEDLLIPFNFCRTHHSVIANLSKVIQVIKGENASLNLEGGYSVPVSVRKKEQVFKLLKT